MVMHVKTLFPRKIKNKAHKSDFAHVYIWLLRVYVQRTLHLTWQQELKILHAVHMCHLIVITFGLELNSGFQLLLQEPCLAEAQKLWSRECSALAFPKPLV